MIYKYSSIQSCMPLLVSLLISLTQVLVEARASPLGSLHIATHQDKAYHLQQLKKGISHNWRSEVEWLDLQGGTSYIMILWSAQNLPLCIVQTWILEKRLWVQRALPITIPSMVTKRISQATRQGKPSVKSQIVISPYRRWQAEVSALEHSKH